MGERVVLFKLKAENKRIRKTLIEYYLGELDREELSEINRDQFYKKLLKNEVETYLEADDMYIENTLKVSVQGEKVAYVEAIVKSLNNRNFQIKSAIDWVRFTQGSM